MLLISAGAQAADENKAEVQSLETVEIVGETPIGGSGLPADKIPSPVQTATSEQLDRTESVSLADYMRRFLGSVNINDAQNNPFQPDVQFRGFTASPLLGLPQGLSVYYNGIRFNEPFGDTVNWDLVPEGAIDTMSLHSGSNPVYGLNSLGGAISVRTKTGFTAPGHTIEVSGGSWGRHSQELISGWNNGTFGYFLDLKSFEEDGWRDYSPTDVKQGFGTLSYKDDRSTANLTLTSNNNYLIGNGAVPEQLFKQDPEAIFTHPDRTNTRLFLASLDGSTWLTDQTELSGTAYFRQNRVKTFNGDDSDFDDCEAAGDEGFLCDDGGAGGRAVDVNGKDVAASDAVEGATNNTSQTHQRGYGGSLQAAFNQPVFGFDNRAVVGGSYDEARVHFESDTELASLTDDRGTVGSGIKVNESRVRLNAKVRHHGLYLTDTFSVTDQLAITAAGRYNLSFINMQDQYPEEGEPRLDGFHKFERFNPSAGLTYKFMPEVGLYGNYSESNRAPTPMELSCADPDAPCKLPNAFLSDPPLDQVVAKTWEAGFRGDLGRYIGGKLNWSAGVFQTENHDDIIFISSGATTNSGYFKNIDKTRRRGIELGLNGEVGMVRAGVNYTLLDATFRTPFTANSPNNPQAVDGEVPVEKGDRIPGIPRHMLKIHADVEPIKGLVLGANMVFNSNQYLRGDEGNLDRPLSEYAVFNLHGEYRYNEHFALFTRIDNLFDKRYQTFGTYGQVDGVLGPDFTDTRFIGVGAPRAGWVGVKLSL
ncbi:TonB-dependent receptor [Methylococcus sp. EFPC2]|uniref:TonB-dependent receptor n=1 Tax=Methylococcus sp. EFPC2 TaxID=2812648 RepID=UPI001967C840|nr:TonB-dependent receptor [Methylococcus sp. EFPC2]QSA96250.1 TonB-dependent receptor [Methylococcus sp. EFPC2]